MALAQSKLTAQGQISVPAEVRRKLGLGPGSVLEWDIDVESENMVVRRGTQFTSDDIHRAIFPDKPEPKTLADLKNAIGQRMRKRYAKR